MSPASTDGGTTDLEVSVPPTPGGICIHGGLGAPRLLRERVRRLGRAVQEWVARPAGSAKD